MVSHIKMPSYIRHPFAVLVALMTLLSVGTAQASERQYKIEAAFLYNFFNYISWPAAAESEQAEQRIICVRVDDPIVPYLQYVQRKMQEEQPLHVQQVTPESGLQGCDMLYQRADGKSPLWEHAHESHTLIVTMSKEPQGVGMINLFQQKDHIAMHINHTHMEEMGYEVSSRLLTLAEHVR